MYNVSPDALAALGGFILVVALIGLAVAILMLAAVWKIFSKAGKPGWAAIIPIYANYVMSSFLFGNSSYFIATTIATVLYWVAPYMGISFLSTVANIANIVLYIILSIKMSKVFGKGGGFAAGLIFLPVIFYPILGFGSAEYIGPQEIGID